MRFASLTCSLVVLLSGAALAAEGDSLVVTGNGVNVRVEPQSSARVVLQVYRNDPAVELRREGDWVEVRLLDRDVTGWIHGSLVTVAGSPVRPAAAAPAPAPAPPPAPEPVVRTASPEPAGGPAPLVRPPPNAPLPAPAADGHGAEPAPGGGSQLAAVDSGGGGDALARFRESVTYLNNRAVAAAGIDLFTEVRTLGDGVVQVTATDAWSNVPSGGQQSFINTLFDRWLAAAGATQPLSVQVVDATGHVLREKSGP